MNAAEWQHPHGLISVVPPAQGACYDVPSFLRDESWCSVGPLHCNSTWAKQACPLSCGLCASKTRQLRKKWCGDMLSKPREAHASADCLVAPWNVAQSSGACSSVRLPGPGSIGLDWDSCFWRCCSPPPQVTSGTSTSTPLLVISQVHKMTPEILDSLTQLQTQIRAGGGHHYVTFLIGDGLEDKCPDDDAQSWRADQAYWATINASKTNSIGSELKSQKVSFARENRRLLVATRNYTTVQHQSLFCRPGNTFGSSMR